MLSKTAYVISLALLAAAVSSPSTVFGNTADGATCAMGSSCQNLGGSIEPQTFDQAGKVENEDQLKAEAAKVRSADPEELEKTIRELEKARDDAGDY